MIIHSPNCIVIHCLASPNGKKVPIEKIRELHAGPKDREVDWYGYKTHCRNWDDVGYHLIFQPDATIDKGRGFEFAGAHVRGANVGSLAFALAGTDKFTFEAFESLKWRILGAMKDYGIPSNKIFGHYEFDSARKQGKTCPNIRMTDLILWIFGSQWVQGSNDIIKPYLIK